MLKLYIQDNGWRGCCVAIASSEAQAREYMKENCKWLYETGDEVYEYEIKEGVAIQLLGDG